MRPDKEKWIEEAMASADSLTRASSHDLAGRVMARAMQADMPVSKEEWIEKVMDSTTGILRAEAPDMTEAVLHRIGTSERHILPRTGAGMAWRIAASVALILALNATAIVSYRGRLVRQEQRMAMQQTAAEFGLGQAPGSDPGTLIFGN